MASGLLRPPSPGSGGLDLSEGGRGLRVSKHLTKNRDPGSSRSCALQVPAGAPDPSAHSRSQGVGFWALVSRLSFSLVGSPPALSRPRKRPIGIQPPIQILQVCGRVVLHLWISHGPVRPRGAAWAPAWVWLAVVTANWLNPSSCWIACFGGNRNCLDFLACCRQAASLSHCWFCFLSSCPFPKPPSLAVGGSPRCNDVQPAQPEDIPRGGKPGEGAQIHRI